jgi:hypothetical protein
MGLTWPGGTIVVGVVFLLIIALIVVTGHCSFSGSVGLGLH